MQDLSSESQAISQSTVKGLKALQTWHYLIPAFVVFWALFAVLLFTNNLLFLVVLATLAPLSCLVIWLAWAFQNDV